MNKLIAQDVGLTLPGRLNWLEASTDWDAGANTGAVGVSSADSDFDECLELIVGRAPLKLRYGGGAHFQTGRRVRVSVRAKVMTGFVSRLEIAAWPASAAAKRPPDVLASAPLRSADQHGGVSEISAIYLLSEEEAVSGRGRAYDQFGLSIFGALPGARIRIGPLRIDHVPSAPQPLRTERPDPCCRSAKDDVVFDNHPSVQIGGAATDGRPVSVTKGDCFARPPLHSPGSVPQARDGRLNLRSVLKYSDYLSVIKNDALALEKGLQTLLDVDDHLVLDLEGREISLFKPLEVRSSGAGGIGVSTPRLIRNGRIIARETGNWPTVTVTSPANYSIGDRLLTNVRNAESILYGMVVEGVGVGEDVYVKNVDAARREVTLSRPLNGVAPAQVYTFRRFPYALDFNAVTFTSAVELADITFSCSGVAGGVMPPAAGHALKLRGCRFEGRKLPDPGYGGHGDPARSSAS